MTTHVFIVNDDTFKCHLEYMFAGTGAGDDDIDFNNIGTSALSYGKEAKLASMIADASRIRRGDRIIFYLQQSGINEGKFFGIFKALNDFSFVDRNDGNQYLFSDGIISKSLLFRTLIEPDIVYAKGVTEWEALDSIVGMASPNQMLWSLIYRKLKANRGNTMITVYESERLCQQIRNKNSMIALPNNIFTFNTVIREIVGTTSPSAYTGRNIPINIEPRLKQKILSGGHGFEAHLQSYIVQHIGRGTNTSLDNCLLPMNSYLEWIGNEVSCGVGMQRIDIALSIISGEQKTFVPIELKAVNANIDNVRQIKRYIEWIEQYYIPNRISDIKPVLIATKYINRTTNAYADIINAFRAFNASYATRCHPIKYIEYELNRLNNIVFNEVDY